MQLLLMPVCDWRRLNHGNKGGMQQRAREAWDRPVVVGLISLSIGISALMGGFEQHAAGFGRIAPTR